MKYLEIIRQALGEAAALFTTQECRGVDIVMPIDEMEAIAVKIAEELNKEDIEPRLGCATTKELLGELSARFEIHTDGGLNYRPYTVQQAALSGGMKGEL